MIIRELISSNPLTTACNIPDYRARIVFYKVA